MKGHGHGRRRQTAIGDNGPVTRLSGPRRLFLKLVAAGGVLALIVFIAWLGFTYVSPLHQSSVMLTLNEQTMSELQRHADSIQTPAGGDNVLVLSVSKPIDSALAPDAKNASPPGWFGQLACVVESRNLTGQTMWAFGSKVEFVRENDMWRLFVPRSPVASSNFGWAVRSSGDQQVFADSAADAFQVEASGQAELTARSGNVIASFTFTTDLFLQIPGTIGCGLLTDSIGDAPQPSPSDQSAQAQLYIIIKSSDWTTP